MLAAGEEGSLSADSPRGDVTLYALGAPMEDFFFSSFFSVLTASVESSFSISSPHCFCIILSLVSPSPFPAQPRSLKSPPPSPLELALELALACGGELQLMAFLTHLPSRAAVAGIAFTACAIRICFCVIAEGALRPVVRIRPKQPRAGGPLADLSGP